MGIGKSSSLLDYLRFGAFYFKDESYIESLRRTGLFNDLQKARFIIFVSTIRERDERFLQKLNAKCPGEPPYNKNILDLIRSGENIVGIGSAYDYVLSIGYNSDCTPGLGSAVFLHCSTGRPTAGCVSIPENEMITILQNLTDGCAFVIDTPENISSY